MAQVIDKIVRSKYPPRDTRVLWFDTTDNSLKSFTSKGWDKVSTKIVENITYSQLKYLRDNGKLIPGCYYRITDYQCTTSRPNTRSAGHQFDIIVRADSENKLNEEASAIQHEGDEYFANSDLNAWQIWYCLDNNTSRFNWADKTNGKGVIYRMIDEWNNDVPYDFKNIQFYRKFDYSMSLWGNISKDNTGVPCYTFCSNDKSSVPSFIDKSLSASNNVYSNVIKEYINSNVQILNNNCFFGNSCSENCFEESCYDNTIGEYCYSNTFGKLCNSNKLREYCSHNIFGESCNSNKLKGYCNSNFFEDSCTSNTIYNYSSNNSFRRNCSDNEIGMSCNSNCLENSCSRNTINDYCSSNSFGNGCNNNSIGQSSQNNSFGNGCNDNSIGKYCYNNTFGNYSSYNTFGESCCYNLLENYCYNNKFGNYFRTNSLGNGCFDIHSSYSSDSTDQFNYYQHNHFGDGCKYILLRGIETASSSAQIQNYNFAQGLQGSSDQYLAIDGVRNRAYETKVAKKSNGELKIYCEADLVQ